MTDLPAPAFRAAVLEPVRAALALLPRSPRPAHAAGHLPETPPAVLVIPGLATNHLATAVLRRRLRSRGMVVRDWGGGLNAGPRRHDMDRWVEPAEHRLHELHRAHGTPVALVGWSLGGIVARELAHRHPRAVRHVFTLGTPLVSLTTCTRVRSLYAALNARADLPDWLAARIRQEPPVPVTALYSRDDGLVNWRSCVQPGARRTRHFEIEAAGHFGLVLSHRVADVVADTLLAAPPVGSHNGFPFRPANP